MHWFALLPHSKKALGLPGAPRGLSLSQDVRVRLIGERALAVV